MNDEVSNNKNDGQVNYCTRVFNITSHFLGSDISIHHYIHVLQIYTFLQTPLLLLANIDAQVSEIAVGNFLGNGIRTASIPELGPGGMCIVNDDII